tara:strand:- start:314112 stop:316460 length:2349 start_codon:yes stop_codon:yes gene_type:complete
MIRNFFFLVLFVPFLTFSQEVTVSGNVKSASDVLLGVNVIEKGTSNGTTTDYNGNYSIKVNQGSTLVFSFLGYKTIEVVVSGKSTIDVTLEEDESQLDEVVIKGFGGVVGQARRRAESVQSIPESVVTFTAEAIETKGITNIQTFSDQIPNVNFTNSQNIGNNFITVRGISHIRNGESPIAFVIDGVTLPDANLINQELFDLALIEVVKGPQGALYGKNAIAGAINIVTNQPTNNFRNKVAVGYASGNLFKAQLSSTGPLVKDKLFYRISGSYKKGDGVIDNETLDKPVDFIEDLTIRGQLKANLSSSITATATGQIIDAKAGGLYYAAPITGTTFSPDDFDNQTIVADQFGRSSLKGAYGNLKVDFNFEKVKLVSSTSYNKGDRNHVGDLDYTPADVLRQIQDSDTKTFNQELKLSSVGDDSKLTWDVGAFYQNSDKLLFTKATADFGFFGPPFLPTGVQSDFATSDFTNTYKTFAAFGFLDYKATDRFTVSFGLRYDNDDISQDNRTLNTNPNKTDSQLQPKVSLALKATQHMLMYANYGRGYRSGGFNQDNTARFNIDYEAEITDNYEIGVKNNYWDDRFILNVSGYYIDFSNQQQYALIIGGDGNIRIGNFNFPESESYGFEADFKLRPSKYLDILASYGVSKSRINKGTSTFSTGANESFDVAGKNTPLIPQDSYTLGLESNFDLSEKVAFNGNVTLKGTGKIYWHEDNAAVSSSYSLLNARVGFTFSNLSLNVWGNNILDKNYITEFFGQPFSNGGSDLVWKGNPATFGLDIAYKF